MDKQIDSLLQKLIDEKFNGQTPKWQFVDLEGFLVRMTRDKENEYFRNRTGSTIFVRPRDSPDFFLLCL